MIDSFIYLFIHPSIHSFIDDLDCLPRRVWTVRYNHFHDQLVLTSSSDSRVILNNLASISSEPYGHLIDDELEDDDDDDNKDKKSVNTEYIYSAYDRHVYILRSFPASGPHV